MRKLGSGRAAWQEMGFGHTWAQGLDLAGLSQSLRVLHSQIRMVQPLIYLGSLARG